MKFLKRSLAVFYILSCGFLPGCKKDNRIGNIAQPKTKDTLRYIPIGDSFTAGHGADADQAYPVLLARDLCKDTIPVKLVVNAAIGGRTVAQAYTDEMPVYNSSNPTFSSLMIGANDWGLRTDTAVFRTNLVNLIETMQSRLPVKTNILVITIPDLSATPGFRNQANGRDITKDVTKLNNTIKMEAARHHLPVADIYPLSMEMHNDVSLIASDSLHPSAKEYARWEQLVILPAARQMLK